MQPKNDSDPAERSITGLCDSVRQTAFEIHRYLRSGHMEKVYENALIHRLGKLGIRAEAQVPLRVLDEDGTVLGSYLADILVESRLLIELKATKAIAPEHIGQLIAYLRATQLEHGLLINFGASRFEIRKFVVNSPR